MATNHEISLAEAIAMTSLYRLNKPSNAPLSETFDAQAIIKLISTTGCKFVRIYYGMQDDLNIDAILVAVDESNADILPPANEESASSPNAILLEDGIRCPPDPHCPPPSPLNS